MGATWPILLILPILVLLLLAFQLAYVLCYRRDHFLRRHSAPSVNVDRSILPSSTASGDAYASVSTPSPSKELNLYNLFLRSNAATPKDAPPAASSAAASTVVHDTSKMVTVQEKSKAAEGKEVCLPPPRPPVEEDKEEGEVLERSSLYYTPPDSPTALRELSAALSGRFCWKDAGAGERAGVGAYMS